LDRAELMEKQYGIMKVVDYLGLHENELGFCEISNHVPYETFLKRTGCGLLLNLGVRQCKVYNPLK